MADRATHFVGGFNDDSPDLVLQGMNLVAERCTGALDVVSQL